MAWLTLGAMPGSPSAAPVPSARPGTPAGLPAARGTFGQAGRWPRRQTLRRAWRWPSAEGSGGPGLPGTAHASTAARSGKTLSAQCQAEKGLKTRQIPMHTPERGVQAESPARTQERCWFKLHGFSQDLSFAPQCDTAEIPARNGIKCKRHRSTGRPCGARAHCAGSPPKSQELIVLPLAISSQTERVIVAKKQEKPGATINFISSQHLLAGPWVLQSHTAASHRQHAHKAWSLIAAREKNTFPSNIMVPPL